MKENSQERKSLNLNFHFSKQSDIWCLMKYGVSSFNSQFPTKAYQTIIAEYGEPVTEEKCSQFIDKYVAENGIDFKEYVSKYQKEWEKVFTEFYKRAERIFGLKLTGNIDVPLTLNARCPYGVEGNRYFFIAVPTQSSNRTAMHELLHFYTWEKYGKEWEDKLGKEKYNEIKEALTVLLNIEFADLLEGAVDNGYPQHSELRARILEIWNDEKDLEKLWTKLCAI